MSREILMIDEPHEQADRIQIGDVIVKDEMGLGVSVYMGEKYLFCLNAKGAQELADWINREKK